MVASEVHYPRSLGELIELLRANPDILIYAGGTDLLRQRGSRYVELPPSIASIDRVPELRQVSLSERYIEIGAAVTLAEILELRENALPELLAQAIRGIANPAVRSLATLGGNLASRDRFMDCWPALVCLDALVELRDPMGGRWVNLNRLVGEEGRPSFPEKAVLTRVRIPLEAWDLTALRKIGPESYPGPETAVFALAGRAEKGILTEFRLAFAGERALRLRDLEGRILGRRLPLSAKERLSLATEYREAAAILPAGLRLQFGALVDGALDLLSS